MPRYNPTGDGAMIKSVKPQRVTPMNGLGARYPEASIEVVPTPNSPLRCRSYFSYCVSSPEIGVRGGLSTYEGYITARPSRLKLFNGVLDCRK